MHPRIAELVDYLDGKHRDLNAAIERVPGDRRDARPGEGRWSVADVLAHLALVEGRIAVAISGNAASARAAGIGADPEATPIIPTLALEGFGTRETRMTSPGAVTPDGTADAVTARSEFNAAHRRVVAAVTGADGVDLSQVSMPHKIFGVMNFYRWIAFVGAHEARHAEQIDEIGRDLQRGRREQERNAIAE